MSIPAMSAGISAVLGTGLSDPARTETAAALTTVAADDCWFEVSINDPMTAMAPTVALTEATRIRRHQGASPVIRLCSTSWLRSPVLLMAISVQPSRCHGSAGP
jgi:hypothetical protein